MAHEKHGPMYVEHVVPRSSLTDEDNYRYYDEFKKLLYTSYCIERQIADFKNIKYNLESKLDTFEQNIKNACTVEQPSINCHQTSSAHREKRNRRSNDMIQRNFQCQHPKCEKSYATEGSLQQHIRLKHGLRNCNSQSQDQDE